MENQCNSYRNREPHKLNSISSINLMLIYMICMQCVSTTAVANKLVKDENKNFFRVCLWGLGKIKGVIMCYNIQTFDLVPNRIVYHDYHSPSSLNLPVCFKIVNIKLSMLQKSFGLFSVSKFKITEYVLNCFRAA